MTSVTSIGPGKLSIPRNPLMPMTSAATVLMSGSLLKSPDGKTVGYAMPLFVATSPTGTEFKMEKRGAFYYFQRGRVFIVDEAKSSAAMLFESAAMAAHTILPAAAELTGWLSTVVEKGSEYLIDRALESTKTKTAHASIVDQVAALEKRGMTCLAGGDLVEVDYQIEPGSWLSKEKHRVIYSYQGADGTIRRYQTGAPSRGEKLLITQQTIEITLRERTWDELFFLAESARHELGDAVTPQKLSQRVLNLLEPMAALYDRTPVFHTMMKELRSSAGESASGA